MAYDYRITNAAENDLADILNYISSELDNPIAASDFMIKLDKKIKQIREFPKSGLSVDNEFISVNNIRKLPLSNYILYYSFDEENECVFILRIIYGKRNPQEIIKEISNI